MNTAKPLNEKFKETRLKNPFSLKDDKRIDKIGKTKLHFTNPITNIDYPK